MDKRTFEPKNTINGPMHQVLKHDSAHKHVSGTADYIDDMPEPANLLHGALGLSTRPHAKILSMDLSEVEASPGVVCVLTGKDVPGVNDVSSAGLHDEPLLAETEVQFHGQPIFAVIGETREAARRAATKAKIEYEDLPFWTDIDDALANKAPTVVTPMTLKRGEAEAEMKNAPRRLSGTMRIGGQEHFYLESHISMAIPGEDDEVTIWASTQHPSEIQHIVGHVLNIPSNAITVNTRRMGGGFGGKETQGNQFAALAAIAAKKLKRAVKFRPDRDEDMTATGKRHDFRVDYEVGFDDDGAIHAVKANYAARCGYSADLSGPVTDRALFHADSSYFYPHVLLKSQPLKTHTVSNTAYRGFGGPQGMVGGERIIEEIAYALGKDPLEIRRKNFYGEKGSDRVLTPYHQTVEDNIIDRIVDELEASSDYQARRQAIIDFNRTSRVIRKGIALTPVKFGISFTMTAFNQAGALVHVYQDGSIHLNHGGTEMGQGLYTKVAQVLADAFQVDIDKVKITATTTGKVPNTSATAASSGTDLNGMAALDAANQIKDRLVRFAAKKWKVKMADITFLPNRVQIGDKEEVPFPDLVRQAYFERVQLSAAGFYKTPNIHWDRASGKGQPFYYFAYGAACSEVSIDTLTGEYMMERTDILHDVGKSLNPAIDIGQVEGAFVQGMGWLTTEELWWDGKGRLRTHAPSTYKIPLASDRPKIFNVQLAEWSENAEPTIGRSKAVGEPPFMLAISVLEALSMAVASVADYRVCPKLDAPATPERILMAVERMKTV
jgi:xanthine dehydrogenase large subunit